MTEFIDPTPDNSIEAARFLSFLDLTAVYAVLEGFYCEQWRHRHPPETMLRLLALYKLKRFWFLTELWRLLDDEILRLLGFRWRLSYKTVWHWVHERLRPEGLEIVHAALMGAINEGLKAKGVQLGWKVAGDASPIQAMKWDKEAGYNGYYKIVCYLAHRLACSVTNLFMTSNRFLLVLHEPPYTGLDRRARLHCCWLACKLF